MANDPSGRPLPEDTPEPIVAGPDGYYWVGSNGLGLVGPFEDCESAQADRDAAEDRPEPGETLKEAESELGINDWLDGDTGEPAEGQSPPHIERE